MNEAERLRKQIQADADALEQSRQRLARLERTCQHQWGKIEYVPDYQPGYRIPSDRERGLELGVDSQPECYVEAKTTRKWQRTCASCGMAQTTTRTKKEYCAGKVAGTGGEVEVPDFGDRR